VTKYNFFSGRGQSNGTYLAQGMGSESQLFPFMYTDHESAQRHCLVILPLPCPITITSTVPNFLLLERQRQAKRLNMARLVFLPNAVHCASTPGNPRDVHCSFIGLGEMRMESGYSGIVYYRRVMPEQPDRRMSWCHK
jgi:hypothetical protein